MNGTRWSRARFTDVERRRRARSLTGLRTRVVVAGLVILMGAAGTAARGESGLAAGSLDLKVTFGMASNLVPCPPDAPPDAFECRARTATGFARGLGNVTEIYGWSYGLGPPTCPADWVKPFATTGRLVVAGKGEITFALAEGARCAPAFPQNEPQELTITGGTGPFAGASGRGTVAERSIGGGVGTETWTGTLEVPGLEFDVTPPTLSGATAKTVRVPKKGAKSARVTFKVTATDDVDGSVPATCQPRSGSRFRIGRTRVTCEATDGSANTATASFTVTVRARR